jgi:endoglucanase
MGLAALVAIGMLGVGAFGASADTPPPRPAHPAALTGVNLAGGDFGPEGVFEGTYGKDYEYPDAAVAAPFRAAGMNTVRLPIRWERIQKAPFAPLDPTEMARIDAMVAGMAGFEAIILDVHNYAKYRDVRLTGDARSSAMLADLWERLARRYKGNAHIAFGLMNEPVDVPAADWARIAAASTRAIRATGARNLILVPGTNWTGAHSWTSGGAGSNAAALAGFRDPGDHFAFELHQYFDWNSSGSNETCVTPGVAVGRLEAATQWLRAQHAQGLLGEFGVARNPACLAVLERVMDYVDRNSDVWLGWTAWAGGGWWGDYAFTLQPAPDGTPRPQMTVLGRHVRKPAQLRSP